MLVIYFQKSQFIITTQSHTKWQKKIQCHLYDHELWIDVNDIRTRSINLIYDLIIVCVLISEMSIMVLSRKEELFKSKETYYVSCYWRVEFKHSKINQCFSSHVESTFVCKERQRNVVFFSLEREFTSSEKLWKLENAELHHVYVSVTVLARYSIQFVKILMDTRERVPNKYFILHNIIIYVSL